MPGDWCATCRCARFGSPAMDTGGRSPDRSPPIRALGGGDILHAARQTVAVVARGGSVGGLEGRGRRRRPPKGDDGDDGGRTGHRQVARWWRGECAPRKGVRDRKPKVITIAEMRKTKYEKIL